MSYYEVLDWIDIEINNLLPQLKECRRLHTIDAPVEAMRSLATMAALIEVLIERDNS